MPRTSVDKWEKYRLQGFSDQDIERLKGIETIDKMGTDIVTAVNVLRAKRDHQSLNEVYAAIDAFADAAGILGSKKAAAAGVADHTIPPTAAKKAPK